MAFKFFKTQRVIFDSFDFWKAYDESISLKIEE